VYNLKGHQTEPRWTGGTACSTIENNAPALVAQAVPPAICDFFTGFQGAVAAPEHVTVIPKVSA
jgi:hypothetical protein